eukprot:2788821-Amphidinium_carterae.1
MNNYTEVTGNVQQPVTSGYEPKKEPSHAIPEITPGLVRRGIEHISNLVRRSISSPGIPRTSPRSAVTGRQDTAEKGIADLYATDWTSEFMKIEHLRQEGAAHPAAHECPQGYQQHAEKEALRMENLVRQSNLERAQQ